MGKRRKDLSDKQTIAAVRQILLEPYQGLQCFDFLNEDSLLYLAFGHPYREIFRRRIVKEFSIEGEWWGLGGTTARASRLINCDNSYCYAREDDTLHAVDIDFYCWTGHTKTWRTCTIPLDQYKSLDGVLGPREAVCENKNNEDKYNASAIFDQDS